MKRKKHPQADRIAKVVRRHWMTLPDAKDRVKAIAREALKSFAPDAPRDKG